jgi:hypothetical protein
MMAAKARRCRQKIESDDSELDSVQAISEVEEDNDDSDWVSS